MSNLNYNTQLDELFKKWEAKSEENNFYGFCRDGLMFKGKFWENKVDGKCYYGRSRGNEDELWHSAPRRVLFLNKDVPYDKNQDIREWIFRQDSNYITYPIYKNIALWLYGLHNVNSQGEAPAFDAINDTKIFSPFMDNTPFAYVNCKKEAGGTSINLNTLQRHMELFKEYLTEQIRILNPDIIVCGGGSSTIKDFVVNNLYTGAKAVNTWMYYDEQHRKLIVDSYHPSNRISGEEMYTKMMAKYKEFLDLYPNFLSTFRN